MNRTSEEEAVELHLREMHRQNPVREVPTDTISNADARSMLKFIAELKRQREAQGLTVQELADRAAVGVDVLNRFEAAHSFNPTISILFRIARALGKRLVVALDRNSKD